MGGSRRASSRGEGGGEEVELQEMRGTIEGERELSGEGLP